jgi:glycosyltransferase involved in cell wall biosynthesis
MVVDSVSVIVPHYNRPDYVRGALESIHAQTVKPAEILLVDDGSTPENREKLKALADLATIVYAPHNLGISGARNLGAQTAKGNWLAFLDDDDLWLPDKQERQIRYLEQHPHLKAVGGGATIRTVEGHEEYWGEQTTYPITLGHALCHTASMSPSLLMRRDVYLAIGGFDTTLRHMEDYEFGIRLLAGGNETHFLAEPFFIYNRGGHQQASVQWPRMYRSEMKVLDMHAALAHKAFGPLGLVRLKARCAKRYGLRMGGIKGRSLWMWGCARERAFGSTLAGVDDQPDAR